MATYHVWVTRMCRNVSCFLLSGILIASLLGRLRPRVSAAVATDLRFANLSPCLCGIVDDAFPVHIEDEADGDNKIADSLDRNFRAL